MTTPKLIKAKNGYFYAAWSKDRRSFRRSMLTDDRTVAEEAFARWLLTRRDAPKTATRAYTVGDAWATYIYRRGDTQATHYSWRNLQPFFSGMPVTSVDQFAVDAYAAARATGQIGRPSKPATCRRELACLVAALNFCTRRPNQLYPASDLQPLTLPSDSKPRDRWLSMEEMLRLMSAAATARAGRRLTRVERFLWIALETAARKQAILDLTWDRVDFETGVVHFADPDRPQTKKKRASVPISTSLRPVLERAYDERKGNLVLDSKTEIWPAIQSVARSAGFGGKGGSGGSKPTATGISPHVLRHTAATHMARNGVPLWTVAQILGNSMAVVEKTYAKWVPAEPERNVDLISNGQLGGLL